MQNQEIHHQRQSIRLQEYDYAQPGTYFVTIVSYRRRNLFGQIINGEMILSQVGEIVKQTWRDIPNHFPNTSIEIFIVMPNHIHGIINIIENRPVGATHESPLPDSPPVESLQPEPLPRPLPESQIKSTTLKPQTLGVIVGLFKSTASKRIHQSGLLNHQRIWQRNYYDHIIRNEEDLQQIIAYIQSNPISWEADLNYEPDQSCV